MKIQTNVPVSEQIEKLKKRKQKKDKFEKIVNAGIAQWVKDFQDGKIQIKSVDDLKKLVEISLMLDKDDFKL